MNCRPGDMALIVSSQCGNEGRIVQCVRYLGVVHGYAGQDRWEIDSTVSTTKGNTAQHVEDKCLFPIRDPGEDARDETLSWLPVPSKEVA